MSEGCKTLELDCKKLDGTGCTRLGQARLDCTRLYEAICCECYITLGCKESDKVGLCKRLDMFML